MGRLIIMIKLKAWFGGLINAKGKKGVLFGGGYLLFSTLTSLQTDEEDLRSKPASHIATGHSRM